ncbi:MAG: hypothetical protein OXH99_05470 [Bryobacterales bacterium]|nr:hypothetical protein [Bryobacterales bacterium]
MPERGVVEVNGAGDDAWLTAESNQVTRYWGRYKSPKWAPPATPVRKPDHEPVESFAFRHLWGQAKPAELIATAEVEPDGLYFEVEPLLPLGLPFVDTAVSPGWFDRPALPDLFPVSFPGVKTSRDGFLVDTDLERLRARVAEYFDPALSHEEIARRYPRVMKSTARFDAPAVRDALLKRGGPDESGFAYRPFDIRWLYWEKDTKLLDEKRADYRPHAFEGNLWLEAREREAEEEFSGGSLVVDLADNFGNGLSSWFPSLLLDDGMASGGREGRRANLTDRAERFLDRLGLGVEDLFHHVLAHCMIPGIERPTRVRCNWNGRASRFRAGRTARPMVAPTNSPSRQRTDAHWLHC